MSQDIVANENQPFVVNPIQDPTLVYYIHPSENPIVSLVSEKFN